MYAVGSNPVAALRSGVDVSRTKIAAYAICGLFAAAGGLTLTMVTGIGIAGAGRLHARRRGGHRARRGEPCRAVVVGCWDPSPPRSSWPLIRLNLVFMGVDPNYSTVIQGVILVVVVMIGGLVTFRRTRA